MPTSGAESTTSAEATSNASTADDATAGDPSTGEDSSATGSTSRGETADDTTSGSDGGSSTGPRDLCPFFQDDFEDGVIDPGWTLSNGIDVAEQGGELVLTITPETGDFVSARRDGLDLNHATITVELGTMVEGEGAQVLLNAFNPSDERLLMIFQSDTISLRRGFPGNPSLQVLMNVGLDPAEAQWARFEIANGVLGFQISSNGDAWTTLLDQPFDWDYSGSSFGLSASNFMPLGAAEMPSFRSFEVCLLD